MEALTLPDHCHRRVAVAGPADLTSTRLLASELAARAGLCAEAAGRLDLVISELATNLIRHAGGGGLLARCDGPGATEVVALDRGPGITDLAAALRDGSALGGGLGYGLGAVRRLADRFAIHSRPNVGTAVLARVQDGSRAPGVAAGFVHGAAMLPMPGNAYCGDGWRVRPDGLVLMIDATGHGPAAALAARRAECVIGELGRDADPGDALRALHAELRGTRGGAVVVLRLSHHQVVYAGIGNVSCVLARPAGLTSLASQWGIVGHSELRPIVRKVAWDMGDSLILRTDGAAAAGSLFVDRQLRAVDPTLAAAILLRDAPRRPDDRAVLVLRAVGSGC